MARQMLDAREADSAVASSAHPPRMMYAKTVAGVKGAWLVIDRILPAELAVGHFHPGAALPAQVRLSNASGISLPDTAPDMRGLAIRLTVPGGSSHDLILANFPTFLARNAEQFFEFFMIAKGCDRQMLLGKLVERFGIAEGRRIAAYHKASFKLCSSLTAEYFWSGCPFLWGRSPVRLELRPLSPPAVAMSAALGRDDALRAELAGRLSADDVRWRLAIQPFLDEERTPIEDAAIDWRKLTSTSLEVATLILPRQNILDQNGVLALREIEELDFNPWNAPPEFRPLGSINRLRRLVYEMAAAARARKVGP
jgi:catalase